MSRLARKPILIPEGVTVTREDAVFTFKGPKGNETLAILPSIEAVIENGTLTLEMRGRSVQARANAGTMAALIRNAIAGVKDGFSKTLTIEGIGFRATMEGPALVLAAGFTHPVRIEPPQGITITAAKNVVTVTGVSKALVGQIAADIRAVKPAEPYLGKGIRYQGEVIRRKTSKKALGATGTKT